VFVKAATRLAVAAAFCSTFLFSESASAAAPDPPGSQKSELNEIVVTAEKREERLQDVPVSVAVLDTTALTDANQTKLLDYAGPKSMQPNLTGRLAGSMGWRA
jgi:iron complex outermembrane receptor protein